MTARCTRRRGASGFTLIEVMVSLGIMMIGAMAVIALQTQTIRANSHARQLSTATQIAQTWIERLKEDAATWRDEATTTASAAIALQNTLYLKDIGNSNSRNGYVSPPAATPPVSRGFDYQGNDANAAAGVPTPFYCAAYRLNWVYVGEAMRADVRVWWPRAGSAASEADFPGCGVGMDQTVLDPGGDLYDDYHVVYLSTVIRVTPRLR